MLLFWSEEHVERWCKQWNRPRGGIMPTETCVKLAYDWYSDRLDPDGRRKTPEEAKAIFDGLGLKDEFWSLA
ncbi:MAG: hypothetical protein QOJ65_2481 [Fimbriimonadaceae bacterium]|jgi:hypothetical protein|nr:hypothetical protein [Fimbriimonadaceae bacterium]